MTSEQIASLEPALIELLEKFRGYFKREKTFEYWRKYILGLLADVKRKSIEPIALAADVPVRTLQEFLAFFCWDHQRADDALQQLVANEHDCEEAIGVIDASGHPKRGDKSPGVHRQYCGQSGKIDNCVMGQHLLYTDNDPTNPFSCVLASDLYLPKAWSQDRDRCSKAGIPDDLVCRPKWRISIEQVERAIGNGIRFSYLTFDEDYGRIPAFWFELDRLGQRGIGEVPPNFHCWTTVPTCQSLRAEHTSRRVDNLATYSPTFTAQQWRRIKIKEATRGPIVWEVKTAHVHLPDCRGRGHKISIPTDRQYWLIVARQPRSGEVKYFVSNAPASAELETLLRVAFARWHIEKWFERAKQETGLGAFEVRTYTSLIRHWLSSRMAMLFLARETKRLRGEKSADNAGADCRCGQLPGVEDLATLAPHVGRTDRTMCVLSAP